MVVCVKQVPDTEARIKIAADRKSIDPAEINFILNPYDEYAVEEALRIKERTGEGEITILCLGPERASSALRMALAMGADKAILLKSERSDLDSLATSKALVEVLKGLEFDLLFFGKQAIDDDNLQVGPMVAELLNLPCVTVVTKLELSDGKAIAHREVEGGLEVVETPLPAVFTAQKGLNEPRYPALKGIMMAKKKPLEERTPTLENSKIKIVTMEYPPARKGGRIVGEGSGAVSELVKLLREEAKML